MKIEFDNLDPAQGSLTVKRPQLEFTLADAGSAKVTISLSRRRNGGTGEPENRNQPRRGQARAPTR